MQVRATAASARGRGSSPRDRAASGQLALEDLLHALHATPDQDVDLALMLALLMIWRGSCSRRVDQVFLACGTFAVLGNLLRLQRLSERHHFGVVARKRR